MEELTAREVLEDWNASLTSTPTWVKNFDPYFIVVAFGDGKALVGSTPKAHRQHLSATRGFKFFDCPMPKSIMRRDIPSIVCGRFDVYGKTDGVRYKLYFAQGDGINMCLAANRSGHLCAVYQKERSTPPLNALFDGTILDGELAYEPSSGRHVFWVFDWGFVSNPQHVVDVSSLAHPERMKKARDFVERRLAVSGLAFTAFELRVKEPVRSAKECAYILESGLREKSSFDGIVLEPRDLAFPDTFKYKIASSNTADFLAKYTRESGVLTGHTQKDYVRLYPLADAPTEIMQVFDRRIVECSYNVKLERWEIVKIRNDKTTANTARTVSLTKQNVLENITPSEMIELLFPSSTLAQLETEEYSAESM